MITINLDVKEAQRKVRVLETEHQKVIQSTLKSLSYNTNQELRSRTDEYFDKGARPYTKKGFRYQVFPSSLRAEFFILGDQAKYMRQMLYGGWFRAQKKALIKPIFSNLPKSAQDQHGNLRRGRLKSLAAQKSTFMVKRSTSDLRAGLYRRVGKGDNQRIEKLVQFQRKRSRRAKYPASKIVREYVQKNFTRIYVDQFNRYISRNKF